MSQHCWVVFRKSLCGLTENVGGWVWVIVALLWTPETGSSWPNVPGLPGPSLPGFAPVISVPFFCVAAVHKWRGGTGGKESACGCSQPCAGLPAAASQKRPWEDLGLLHLFGVISTSTAGISSLYAAQGRSVSAQSKAQRHLCSCGFLGSLWMPVGVCCC